MAMRTVAGQWLAENGDFRYKRLAMWKQHRHAQTDFAQHLRDKAKGPSVKDFVHDHRSHKGSDRVFVPGAIRGKPAMVQYLDRKMSAARYMGLLTLGAPKDAEMVIRHTCGNGHLSCVNPAHLRWGTQRENRSDAVKHRSAKTTDEKINSLFGKL